MSEDDERLSHNATVALKGKTVRSVHVQRNTGVLRLHFTDGTVYEVKSLGDRPTLFIGPLPRYVQTG